MNENNTTPESQHDVPNPENTPTTLPTNAPEHPMPVRQPVVGPKKSLSKLVLILIIATILVLAGGAAAAYFLMSNSKPDKTTAPSPTAKNETTTKKALAWKEGDFAVEGTYADADVIKIADGKWRLYYAIQPEVQGNKHEVYSSTSTDGKTWTREDGVRKTMATFPEVVQTTDGKYRMYYQTGSVLKSAISTDGLTFTDEAGTRMDKTNSVGLTFDNVAAPAVLLLDDKTYMMVYRGTINTRYAADTPNATTQLLMWATSTDGLAFTQKGIAVDSRDATLRGQLDGPDMLKWSDGKLHVFSTTYAGVYEFVFDGTKFGKGTLAYALASDMPAAQGQGNVKPPDVAPPGDPTLAQINDTWYMYYGGSRDKNGIRYATFE